MAFKCYFFVSQACEILRVGLPHRISYIELKEAVSYIMVEAIEIFKGEPEEVFIASLFYAFEVQLHI